LANCEGVCTGEYATPHGWALIDHTGVVIEKSDSD
jgi:hypothetical protein